MGNLTRDPEIKTIGSNTVANCSVAVNRRYTSQTGEKREEVTYVDVTFWGKQAEILGRLGVKKGAHLFIEGRLHTDTWEDKATGQKRSKLKVVGEVLQLLGGKPTGEHQRTAGGNAGGRDIRQAPPATEEPQGGSFYSGETDEPF